MKVVCRLCPKLCRLDDMQTGDCRVRYNRKGTLTALTFGRPAAINTDPIEKKPLFHFLPGSHAFSIATVGCNLHCLNCQNAGLSQVDPLSRRAYVASPGKIVSAAIKENCASVALTYTDPVVFYEYAVEIGRECHKKGLRSLWITAGYIEPAPLKSALPFMDAVNLDIKAMTDSFYRDTCGATLAPVLNSAEAIKGAGVWLEITNLVIPGKNDSDRAFRDLSRFITKHLGPETPLHFSRFFPHHKLRNIPATPAATLRRAREIAKSEGVKYVYLGNMRRSPDAARTSCSGCGATLIERYGYLVISNRIRSGRCPVCNTHTPGVWR